MQFAAIQLEAGAPEHRGEDDQRRRSVDERDELGVECLTDELLERRPKVVCASSVAAHITPTSTSTATRQLTTPLSAATPALPGSARSPY
jgi:hypothetical protein